MHRLSAIVLALAVIIGPTGSLRAATEELQRAVLRPEFWTAQRLSVADRRHITEGMIQYWRGVSDRIPRLPPAERRWVEGELRTTDPARLAAAFNRKEGALYMAADAVEFCLAAYEALAKQVGSGSKSEALAWVHSLRCYSSASDLPIHLFKGGVITAVRNDGEVKMQLFSVWTRVSLRALESALLE